MQQDLPNENDSFILPKLLLKSPHTHAYKMLQILLLLLQCQKTVTVEKLATVFPQPILFESRRRSIQRFLSLPQLSLQLLWFPLLKHWVKVSQFQQGKRLTFAINRTPPVRQKCVFY